MKATYTLLMYLSLILVLPLHGETAWGLTSIEPCSGKLGVKPKEVIPLNTFYSRPYLPTDEKSKSNKIYDLLTEQMGFNPKTLCGGSCPQVPAEQQRCEVVGVKNQETASIICSEYPEGKRYKIYGCSVVDLENQEIDTICKCLPRHFGEGD